MGEKTKTASIWKILLFTMAVLICGMGIAGTGVREVKAATAGFVEIGGKTYYQKANGQFQKGWLTLNGRKYFFNLNTGVMLQGWGENSNGRRYFQPNGAMAVGKTKIGNDTYYFNPQSGYMVTGWKTINGKKYFFNARTGIMLTGWGKNEVGKRYFHKTEGYMYTGMYKLASGGNTYYRYFDPESGYMATGKKSISGKTYYFEPATGLSTIGWVTIGGNKYYFNEAGVMVTGDVKIGDVTYRFNSNGVYQGKANLIDASANTSKTLKGLLINALLPVGSTLYQWGGGHDENAVLKGVNPAWKQAFNGNGYLGLDCSGYVGWSIYQVMGVPSTASSGGMIDLYTSRGWGGKFVANSSKVTKYCAGDIIANGDHVWMVLGQCKDGSVVILHSGGYNGLGPQIAGTPTKSGDWNSEAYNLARTYMLKYSSGYRYGYGYNMWDSLSYSYLLRWNRNTALTDPDGFANMTADEILQVLSPYIGD